MDEAQSQLACHEVEVAGTRRQHPRGLRGVPYVPMRLWNSSTQSAESTRLAGDPARRPPPHLCSRRWTSRP
jgi:hypothetical protein